MYLDIVKDTIMYELLSVFIYFLLGIDLSSAVTVVSHTPNSRSLSGHTLTSRS